MRLVFPLELCWPPVTNYPLSNAFGLLSENVMVFLEQELNRYLTGTVLSFSGGNVYSMQCCGRLVLGSGQRWLT